MLNRLFDYWDTFKKTMYQRLIALPRFNEIITNLIFLVRILKHYMFLVNIKINATPFTDSIALFPFM